MKGMTHFIRLTLLVIGAIAMAGCTTPGVGSADYNLYQVRGEQAVRLGIIMSLRKIKIDPNQSGTASAIGGGVAGAALGNRVGQGYGNSAAVALGALALGALGDMAQHEMAKKDGYELTIRLDTGLVIAVTQGADEAFTVGERVQVIGGANLTRVTRLDEASSLNQIPGAVPPAGSAPSASSVVPRLPASMTDPAQPAVH